MTNYSKLPRGPVVVDIAGHTLTDSERERLSHPLVGGVILFRRNFVSREQLKHLTAEIRALRSPSLLIAVDHEGGRVQRFHDGFTRLPPMQVLGKVWQRDPDYAKMNAENIGYVLAVELRAAGIDLSFTPVLDLDWGRCAVIGNRAFHRDPQVVTELALALQKGLQRGGMNTCGKHFPGHGWVEGDSHHVVPTDERSVSVLNQYDLVPFQRLIAAGLGAIMPAHVIYSAVDPLPAGYSQIWLQKILRATFNFDGVIFSDDLCMEGAAGVGSVDERARVALAAGCDMVLICNRPDWADILLKTLSQEIKPQQNSRIDTIIGQGTSAQWEQRLMSSAFAKCQTRVLELGEAWGEAETIAPPVGEA